MGERKVLNKYFPPDFDPSKLPRGKRVRSEDTQMKVRMMLPMSVRCNTCGNFMYKGTKFNTRMEDVRGEDYLGIKIFRFYYRCTNCAAEFCMKTDPKTADYIVEGGASRNYEPWRDQAATKAMTAAQREEEEKGNAMKALENRTLDSKREMDIMAALDEMKSLKSRHEAVDSEAALAALKRSAQNDETDLDAEDEAVVRQMLLQRAGFVQRLSDSDDDGSGEGGEQAAGGGRGTGGGPSDAATAGAPAAGQFKRARGVGGPSVASAAWDEEEEQEEDGQQAQREQLEAAGAPPQQQQQSQPASEPPGNGLSKGRGVQAGAAAGKQQRPAVSFAAPPPLPKFGGRPAAVVVKRKPVAAPVQQAAAPATEEDSGGALLGLGGYGSGSGGDSD